MHDESDDSMTEDDYLQGIRTKKREEEGILELKHRVDRAYGISREIGLKWMEAARYGDMKTIKKLISWSEAENNNCLSRLLHYNGQATTYGFIGSIALHWACANGDEAMSELLLSKGSAVNCQNNGGSTPLHSACANAQSRLVQVLLACGANPSIVDCCQDTPTEVIPEENKRSIAPLLMHADIAAKLQREKNEANWSVAEMKMLVNFVEGGTVKTHQKSSSSPTAVLITERSELVDATKKILAQFSEKIEKTKSADIFAAKLHRKVLRRQEKLQELWMQEQQEEGEKREKLGMGEEKLDKSNKNNTTSSTSSSKPSAAAKNPSSFPAEYIEEAEESKKRGNDAFAAGNYKLAVQMYSLSIHANPAEAVYYSNRCAGYLHLQQPLAAVKDAAMAVKLRPKWAKAYHRLGSALVALGRDVEGKEAFECALGLLLKREDDGKQYLDVSAMHSTVETLESQMDECSERILQEKEDRMKMGKKTGGNSDEQKGRASVAQEGSFPPAQRKPWFDCAVCENKTRDEAFTNCCQKKLCGTCAKRFIEKGKVCPFCSESAE